MDSQFSPILWASSSRAYSSFLRSSVHSCKVKIGPLLQLLQSNAMPSSCQSLARNCTPAPAAPNVITKANGAFFAKLKAAAASVEPMLNAFMAPFFRLQSVIATPVVRPRMSTLRSWCKWVKQLGARCVAVLAMVIERDAPVAANVSSKRSKTECAVHKLSKTSRSRSLITGARPASATTVASTSAAMDRFQPTVDLSQVGDHVEGSCEGWIASNVDLLDTAFPPTSNVSYAKAETLGEPGSKKLRLWMLGIHPDSGNSGMMVNDDAETLVQLICVYGFRTEADKMIGVEMFTGKTADQSFTTAINRITPYEKKTNLAQVHSVWHNGGDLVKHPLVQAVTALVNQRHRAHQ